MMSIIKSAQLQALVSNAIFAAAGLLSFMILSRNITPLVFGQWVLFVSIATLLDLVRFGITRPAAIRLIASSDETHQSHIINGAGFRMGIYILLVIAVVSYGLYSVGRNVFSESYLAILLWYPILALANLGWNNALTFLQGQGRYSETIMLRLISMIVFIVLILGLIYLESLTLSRIIMAFIAANLISSTYSMIRGWDSASYLFICKREHMAQIFSFGRYAVISTIGSSLLKSADSVIISLSPVLGPTGIAIYAIPFKIVEMLELPIRSISMVGYNAMSKAFKINNRESLRLLMTRNAMLMAILTLPIMVGIGLCPRLVLNILGGSQYTDHMPLMVAMLYTLLIYGVMLIPDRLTGIALEAMGRPEGNMKKVLIMAACNIAGDFVAVFWFQSLFGVVLATVFFVMVGNLIGYRMIPRDIRPRIEDIILVLRQWKIKS